jgi:hypothetical protein
LKVSIVAQWQPFQIWLHHNFLGSPLSLQFSLILGDYNHPTGHYLYFKLLCAFDFVKIKLCNCWIIHILPAFIQQFGL